MSRWVPLESNPEVLNSWSTKAGLVSTTEFGDIYGLDESLLDMVPQPVHAVVLLFPISDESERKRKEEDAKIEKDGQPQLDPTLLWIKQTISNACGTMGLIHAIANSAVTLEPESPLAKFIDQCSGKTPEERAKLLETTPLFADIHAQAASSGQSAVPTNLDTNLHFTAVTLRMRLIELDGRRVGPIDRGECTDLLKDVGKFIQTEYMSNSNSMQFSMMYLGPRA
ncbi:peptidase C12, ubiquitin carboxyl-terminal hydrolase [Mycena rebaudengoi]|nr:peptidase C12, ubiquitin carboxyl-terminal hydrolase [Mycena rebaudengoi]